MAIRPRIWPSMSRLDLVGGFENDAAAVAHGINPARWLGVDFELSRPQRGSPRQVDDPVSRNAPHSVGQELLSAIIRQRRVGNFNHERHTRRIGLNGIVARLTSYDR